MTAQQEACLAILKLTETPFGTKIISAAWELSRYEQQLVLLRGHLEDICICIDDTNLPGFELQKEKAIESIKIAEKSLNIAHQALSEIPDLSHAMASAAAAQLEPGQLSQTKDDVSGYRLETDLSEPKKATKIVSDFLSDCAKYKGSLANLIQSISI